MRATGGVRRLSRVLAGAAAALLGAVAGRAADRPEALWTVANPRVREVVAVQEEFTPEVMVFEEILGTAVGLGPDGDLALVVYADQNHPGVADVVRAIPPRLRGVAVSVCMTDKFVAMGKPGNTPNKKPVPVPSVDHKVKQRPPIQLGTSGGWGYDLANGYCCGGTLGSLVKISETQTQYILSNYHVFEADTVDGGNTDIDGTPAPRIAQADDPVIQPGLIDVGCNVANAQIVARLSGIKSLPDSNVDAAIAAVVTGMVDPTGAILEIGTISSQTVTPFINQAVKKSGRTTGLTRSKITGLNGTINVSYENECAGGAAFIKTFTNQIIIANRRSKFLAGGDSGSLMVEDVATNPRAVGLLFAGSSTLAVANPIDEVLDFLTFKLESTATMVGVEN